MLNQPSIGFSVLLETPPAGSGADVPNGTTLWVAALDATRMQSGVAGLALEGQAAGDYTFLPSDWTRWTARSLDYSPAIGAFVSLATAGNGDTSYIAINGTGTGPYVLFDYPPAQSPGAVTAVAAGLTYLPPSGGGRVASSLVGMPDRSIGMSTVDLVAGVVTETRTIQQDASIRQYLDIVACPGPA